MDRSRFLSRVGGGCLLAAGLAGAVTSATAQISFSNVTGSSGITDTGETFSTGWGDFEGTGFPGIWLNKHQYTPTRIFYNLSGSSFTEVADDVLKNEEGVPSPQTDFNIPRTETGPGKFSYFVDTHGLTSADWDNDGDQDVLEVTGANYIFPIWENDGLGNFEYRGDELGLDYPLTWERRGRPPTGGRDSLFFDYDRDGWLDVMIMARENYSAYRTPTAIFRQDRVGGETFFTLDESTGVVPDAGTGPFPGTACEFGAMAELSGDSVLDVICSDSQISAIWDVSQLPFADLRPVVGNEIFNRYPADLAIGDFNNDLRTDIMAPTFAGADYVRNLVGVVDGQTLHGWFNASVPYNSGFNFSATGNVTFEFDWWTEIGEVFYGAAGTNPHLSANLPTMPFQEEGHGDPHHIVLTLSPTQAQGIMTPDPDQSRGVYIGYVNGQWQVRFSGISSWQIGMVITAQSGISGLTSVGGTKIGQDTGGNALLFLQSEDHELVFSGGNVQAVNRSCTAAAAADFDNDMDLDVFFACSGQLSNLPDIVYENQGDGTFVPVPAAGGAEGQMPLGRADSVMVADYDEDCRMDVYVTNGHHFRPFSYAGIHQLFRNTTSDGNHCIQIDLEGTVSNRDGIGAIVYATTPDGTVQKRDQNGGKHKKAQDYQRVHFGLGTNQIVDLEVHWPSGIVETFGNVAADQVVELVEGTGGNGPSYSLSVDSPTVTEGTDTEALFTVTLTPAPATGETVSVAYQTVAGTATADSDYTPTSGTLTFVAGDGSETVSVPILDDGTSESTETFALQATSSQASAANGTATILDDDGNGGDPTCGMPTFDPAVDRGVYLWNDCGTNDWHLRITGGGSGQYLNHLGTLVADAPFVSVNGFSIEANDTLDVAGSQIDFGLIVGGVYEDGIDFTLAEGASVCFTLTSPSGLAVFGGVDADPVSLPVSMPGLGACGGGGGDPTDPTCGMPTFDPASDRGVYLWKDCGTDDWHLRITGGGSGQYLNHVGRLVADAPFLDVTGVSIEGNDTLDIGASQIDFGLIVGGVYEDGIDFTLAEGASVCFSLTSPSGLSVFGGVDAEPVTLPVSMPGFGACDGGGGDPTDPTCGMPSFDPTSDRGAFLWRDCGTDDWHLRITGGGNGQYVGHVGSLVADAPFVSVDGVSVETNDTLDITASQVDFGLIVGGIYEDGIDFTLSEGASACFTLDSPTDVSVFGGVDGTNVGSPVAVPGFGVCAAP